jgi:hypothetical protein
MEMSPVRLPVILKPAAEVAATQSEDGVGSANHREHSGLLEAAADHTAISMVSRSRATRLAASVDDNP